MPILTAPDTLNFFTQNFSLNPVTANPLGSHNVGLNAGHSINFSKRKDGFAKVSARKNTARHQSLAFV